MSNHVDAWSAVCLYMTNCTCPPPPSLLSPSNFHCLQERKLESLALRANEPCLPDQGSSDSDDQDLVQSRDMAAAHPPQAPRRTTWRFGSSSRLWSASPSNAMRSPAAALHTTTSPCGRTLGQRTMSRLQGGFRLRWMRPQTRMRSLPAVCRYTGVSRIVRPAGLRCSPCSRKVVDVSVHLVC